MFIISCRHDAELHVNWLKVSSTHFDYEGHKTVLRCLWFFSFDIKRRKKRVNNDFKGDYFIEKQEKMYV